MPAKKTGRTTSAKAFFPIMPWGFTSWTSGVDAKTFMRMKECGFTLAGMVREKELPLCRRAGLRAIVEDPAFCDHDWLKVKPKVARENIQNATKRMRKDPTVYGYYLKDEPAADQFAGLGQVAGLVRELHSGALPYINLFPTYADREQLGTPTYEEYLREFVQHCKPPVISYDHYATMADATLRKDYFRNLDLVRTAALSAKVPFWNIVLSVGHLVYAEPSPADLRFQAYTSLAYGAGGLSWFTYFTPKIGDYRLAALDQFDDETPTWGMIRNINKQILALAPTYLGLASRRVYHFGAPVEGGHRPEMDSYVESIEGDILVGDFDGDGGKRYVFIVNRDRRYSRMIAPKFRAVAKAKMISPYDGQEIPFAGEQCWLAPGQGALLRLS